jgi:hypothetical protein
MSKPFTIIVSAAQKAEIERFAREHSMLPSVWARRVLRKAVQKGIAVTEIEDTVSKPGRPKRSAKVSAEVRPPIAASQRGPFQLSEFPRTLSQL